MKKRLTLTAAMSAGLFLLLSGNAWTGSNALARTTDWGVEQGGVARFIHDGDKVSVCDGEADGYGATATLRRHDGPIYATLNASGNGNCTSRTVDIREGELLKLTVCLNDSAQPGRLFYCGSDPAQA
ncbi:hypothetical protein [Streptomyces agglomeratus]|uniref:hypothetical protein n=1 Tax=Streptomyces agglomeratus TaxID=285458 RepID=UPI00114D0E09|nr:hypothetical protein [Streptomyces agglomeratus]